MEGAAPGKLRLKVIGGNAAGAEIQIEDELLIGRLAEGPGNLAEDIEISRRHARIARTSDTEYRIEDLGSTNGTMVNGRKITAPEVLMTGDKIEIGQTTLVVQYSASFPAAETPRAGTVVPAPETASEEPAEAPVEEALAGEAPPAETPPDVEPAYEEAPPGVEPAYEEAEPVADEPYAEEPPAEAPPEGVPDPFAPIEGAAADAVAPEVEAAEEAAPEPPVAEGFPPTEQMPPGEGPTEQALPGEVPVDDAAPEPAAAPPPLGLRLEVDFEAGEVILRLDDESEPVRFVHEDGRWRIAGS